MKYVNATLIKDEAINHEGKGHWFVYVRPTIYMLASVAYWLYNSYGTFAVIGIIGFMFSLYLFVTAIVYMVTTEMAVTNKRILVKTGWIKRKTIELNLNKVESVQVDQTIFGRIFNFGSVHINGSGLSSAKFKNIEDPLLFRVKANEAMEQI